MLSNYLCKTAPCFPMASRCAIASLCAMLHRSPGFGGNSYLIPPGGVVGGSRLIPPGGVVGTSASAAVVGAGCVVSGAVVCGCAAVVICGCALVVVCGAAVVAALDIDIDFDVNTLADSASDIAALSDASDCDKLADSASDCDTLSDIVADDDSLSDIDTSGGISPSLT